MHAKYIFLMLKTMCTCRSAISVSYPAFKKHNWGIECLGMGHIIQAAGWLYAFKVLQSLVNPTLRCLPPLSVCPLTSCHDCCRNYINQCMPSTTQLFSDSLKILCLIHMNYCSYYIVISTKLFGLNSREIVMHNPLCSTVSWERQHCKP